MARTPAFSGEHGLACGRPLSDPGGPLQDSPWPGEQVGTCTSGPHGEASPVSAAENRVGNRQAGSGLGSGGTEACRCPTRLRREDMLSGCVTPGSWDARPFFYRE